MTFLILLFGASTFLAGTIIIVRPETLFGVLRRHAEKLQLHVLAVAVRLILGTLLLHQASGSKYPLAIEIIGWLSIAAAVCFAMMGRRLFRRLMSWALSVPQPYGRIGGVLAAGFGAFLVYAFA